MILDPHARLAPADVADATAFQVGAESYTWDDIVLAATLWGDWQELRERARASVAAVHYLRGCQAAPTADEIERAADEFRYARNLITAAETEAWLSRRALDFEDLLEFVERSLAVNGSDGAPRVAPPGHQPGETEVDAALWGDAVCSGALAQFAGRLANRAAVHERLRRERQAARPANSEGIDRWSASAATHRCMHERENGALGLQASPLRRLQWLRHLDDAFADSCAGLITPAAVTAEIRLHQLDWVRVRVQYALFDSADAAREAMLCMSQDCRTLAQVGDHVGFIVREDSWWLEQVEDDHRCAFLAAQPDGVVGPLRWGAQHGVFAVLDKRKPCPDDVDTWTRAHDAALARTLQHEVERWVCWQERL